MTKVKREPFKGQLKKGQRVIGFTNSGQGGYGRVSYKKCWDGIVSELGEKNGKLYATIERSRFTPVRAVKVGGKVKGTWLWSRSSSGSYWNTASKQDRIVVPVVIDNWKKIIGMKS